MTLDFKNINAAFPYRKHRPPQRTWIEILYICNFYNQSTFINAFYWNCVYFHSQSTLMLFLFCCKGGDEGIWIDPPPLLDPRFRRAPLELSCVGLEFRMIFILRCRFPCCTGRAYSLVLCMNIRRVAWPWFLNVTVVIETALVSFT